MRNGTSKLQISDFPKKIIKIDRNEIKNVGTPHWMAPEIYRDQSNSKYSDIWSFGLIIWEILFLKVPFNDYNYYQLD